MFIVTVKTSFPATHRVCLPDGRLETAHRHEWEVRARFARPYLDDHGKVVDFDHARAALESAVQPLRNADLNDCPVLAEHMPTAEVLARYVFDRLRASGFGAVCRVEILEAPGCEAAYEPGCGLNHPTPGDELTMDTAGRRL